VNGKNATVTIETEVENKNLNPTNAVVYSILQIEMESKLPKHLNKK
jgi:hypothetical protein